MNLQKHYSKLDRYQLRAECNLFDIEWCNAHGENRHLTKAEMIDRLVAAAQEKSAIAGLKEVLA